MFNLLIGLAIGIVVGGLGGYTFIKTKMKAVVADLEAKLAKK